MPPTHRSRTMHLTFPYRARLAVAVFLVLLPAYSLGAQGAVFAGTVTDSTKKPLADVDVQLTDVSLTARTNGKGEFTLANIPAGTHDVAVRRIGYGVIEIRIDFPADQRVERQFRLSPTVTLESMRVVDTHSDMPGFDDHRRLALGAFLTRAELEPQENRRLAEILRQFKGVKIETSGTHTYITSALGIRSAKTNACYALVYLNRALVFRGDPGEDLFDLSSIQPTMIEAIEFYSTAAKTPMQYTSANSDCGVLVIWTRRTP
jgi:hypothetical protein